MSTASSSAVDINVLIVIDTDYVKIHYPKPSQNPNRPTVIYNNSQYMICADPRGIISGQGTTDLNFIAARGDNISFRGISIYGNSDDAVIVYAVKHKRGNRVFSAFETKVTEIRHAVVPDASTQDGLPPSTVVGDFISYDSKVVKSGAENFKVYFALYTLDDKRETQELYGYYCWDSSITVKKNNEAGA